MRGGRAAVHALLYLSEQSPRVKCVSSFHLKDIIFFEPDS